MGDHGAPSLGDRRDSTAYPLCGASEKSAKHRSADILSLGWQSTSFCKTATTPSQFARAIVELGENDEMWHTTRTEMLAAVRRDFGDDAFHQVIERVTASHAGDVRA